MNLKNIKKKPVTKNHLLYDSINKSTDTSYLELGGMERSAMMAKGVGFLFRAMKMF